MPADKESHEIPLKCNNCGHEFPGMATYTVHTVAEEPGWAKRTLGRIHTKCPNCDSHDVKPRGAQKE